MALIPVDRSQVAAVVTYLEMARPPKPSPVLTSPLRLVGWEKPSPKNYRVLFKRVGEPWLWFSRLIVSDIELDAILTDPKVEVYAVLDPKGIEVGILELDFRVPERCEIAFFGLVPQLSGQGLGRWLMSQALTLGWRKDVRRLTVQTSSIDDPRALALYMKTGFMPVSRALHTFDDPRLLGLAALDAAPHVPILKKPSAPITP